MPHPDKSDRSAAIATAVAKLEQLLLSNLSPGKFGFVRVEAVIQDGSIVRIESSQTDSLKMAN
jgi:hypothetical protein